jgi:hypothetical protein
MRITDIEAHTKQNNLSQMSFYCVGPLGIEVVLSWFITHTIPNLFHAKNYAFTYEISATFNLSNSI